MPKVDPESVLLIVGVAALLAPAVATDWRIASGLVAVLCLAVLVWRRRVKP